MTSPHSHLCCDVIKHPPSSFIESTFPPSVSNAFSVQCAHVWAWQCTDRRKHRMTVWTMWSQCVKFLSAFINVNISPPEGKVAFKMHTLMHALVVATAKEKSIRQNEFKDALNEVTAQWCVLWSHLVKSWTALSSQDSPLVLQWWFQCVCEYESSSVGI